MSYLAQSELWETLARQVPNLMVLVILVLMFLKYLSKRDELLKDISAKCHDVQERAILVIEGNTEQSGKTEKVLDEVKVMLVKQSY